MATPIASAAQSFVSSYARALQLSNTTLHPTTASNTTLKALALNAHFGPNMPSYTLGSAPNFNPVVAGGGDANASTILNHLRRYERVGLGHDLYSPAVQIEPASDTSALCWITWLMQPWANSTVAPWEFRAVYAYRRGQQQQPGGGSGKEVGAPGEQWTVPEGYWEFMISDNEMFEVLKRVPGVLTA